MGSRVERTLQLATPLALTELFEKLATVLPALVRFSVERATSHDDPAPRFVSPQPPLEGPATPPRYTSAEHGVSGCVELHSRERDGVTHLSVTLEVTQALFSRGMSVLSLWTGSVEPIRRLWLEVDPDRIDETLAIVGRVAPCAIVPMTREEC